MSALALFQINIPIPVGRARGASRSSRTHLADSLSAAALDSVVLHAPASPVEPSPVPVRRTALRAGWHTVPGRDGRPRLEATWRSAA
ncbi:hypothetical protein [Kitasatospora sp. HPMI-4]|uniref:hypothetical protein n=1 Tax=Kitasatospora sp. HPMI-4 TaxID=3448443 RepID=UPI003F1B9EB3